MYTCALLTYLDSMETKTYNYLEFAVTSAVSKHLYIFVISVFPSIALLRDLDDIQNTFKK